MRLKARRLLGEAAEDVEEERHAAQAPGPLAQGRQGRHAARREEVGHQRRPRGGADGDGRARHRRCQLPQRRIIPALAAGQRVQAGGHHALLPRGAARGPHRGAVGEAAEGRCGPEDGVGVDLERAREIWGGGRVVDVLLGFAVWLQCTQKSQAVRVCCKVEGNLK